MEGKREYIDPAKVSIPHYKDSFKPKHTPLNPAHKPHKHARTKIKLKNKRDVTLAVEMFKNSAYVATDKQAFKAAKELKSYIVNTIKYQRYRWHPLSKDYADYKKDKGYDPRIYIQTNEFIKHIVVKKTDQGYLVGLSKGNHSKAHISYAHLAAIHEFGTTKIPARPLWRTATSVFVRKNKMQKMH